MLVFVLSCSTPARVPRDGFKQVGPNLIITVDITETFLERWMAAILGRSVTLFMKTAPRRSTVAALSLVS